MSFYHSTPVVITYELTPYSSTLENVLRALSEWGAMHREKIMKTEKTRVY